MIVFVLDGRNLTPSRFDKTGMSTSVSILLAVLRALSSTIASALSPPRCAACDANLKSRAVFCATCASAVEPATSPPSGTVAFAVFHGPIADALRRFKYNERPDLAAPLGQLASHAAREAKLSADLVIPVPLHPRRLAERGYNQAALLASKVASALDADFAPRALCRTRHTPQQARLDREGRLGNVAGAFQVRSPRAVRGRRVLLVDDVVTTGATIDACREALLAAGATSVVALAVACAEKDADAASPAA